MKALLLNLPLLAAVFLLGILALVDAGVLSSLRNESTFGWQLVLWYPLCALLGLVQVIVWARWIAKRRADANAPKASPRLVSMSLTILAVTMLGLVAYRVATRWGLLE